MAVVETKPKEAKEWFHCTTCSGTGEVVVHPFPKRPDFEEKRRCGDCSGRGALQLPSDEGKAMSLFPVRPCGKCENWYIVGGGYRGKCPNKHAGEGDKTCCHWNDISTEPPTRERGA